MIRNKLYDEDLDYLCKLKLPYEKLYDKTVLITGATGLIGSCLVDVLMKLNEEEDAKITIYALGRNVKKAMEVFGGYFDNPNFFFISHDINKKIEFQNHVDYIIHGASNTHPVAYANDPVGTITTNVFGMYNLLEYAINNNAQRIMLLSSVEIYGENTGEIDKFKEDDMGYIDCNTMRAGYCEGKRVAESLCQSYNAKYGIDVVIARLCRTYGPTMSESDSKANAQFIRNAVKGEDIVLKSKGDQYYSYIYMTDAVAALLTILLKGESKQAYNIADEASDITLANLAKLIAGHVGKEVIFKLPDEDEKAGFSKATKAILDATKLKELGFSANGDIKSGIGRTIDILKSNIYR